MKWTNYKQAADIPPAVVERMWRTLDHIANACNQKHPAMHDFMTKDDIRAAAQSAVPNDADQERTS